MAYILSVTTAQLSSASHPFKNTTRTYRLWPAVNTSVPSASTPPTTGQIWPRRG
jgi:hypothetical protein